MSAKGALNDLQALRLFVRVARLGSFSAAARECGISQPQASRIIADLEASLGARLLARTTRAVKPTDAGEEFLARTESILAALEEAESSVREKGSLVGVLRVGMPTIFGLRYLLPHLAPFVDQHPELRVEVMLDDRFQDMVREAVDVGIRVGSRPDGSGTAVQLGEMGRVIVAAPSYLERAGTPRSPSELLRHRIIAGPATTPSVAWRFERDGEVTGVTVEARLMVNDTAGAVAAARFGLGITSTTSWSCKSELADGSLVKLLGKWKMAPVPFFAYFPAGKATKRAARTFVEFLKSVIHSHGA